MQQLKPSDPRSVGPFVLLGRLGAGGMGKVYLGRSPGGRTVAVKVVHAHLLDADPSFRSRFRREVDAAKRVGGFYTVAIVDSDADGDPPWYASAYIDAPSLDEVVRSSRPLDLAAAAALGAQLAEALTAIHGAGLVHRDLKPSNVLMAPDGARVIDFGIVRDAHAHTVLTGTGMNPRSVGFAPPEQMRGRPVTMASDVFALGASLVFATTRRLPFPGRTEAAVDRRMDSPPDLSGVPGPLHAVLSRCLALDPDERPSPAELVAAFDGAGRGAGATKVVDHRDVPRGRTRVVTGSGDNTQEPPVPEAIAARQPTVKASPVADGAKGSRPDESARDAETRRGPDRQGSITGAALVVGAVTVAELHWLAGLSWWPAVVLGLVAGVAAGVLLAVALYTQITDSDFDAVVAMPVLVCGVGAAILTVQRTSFPWWGVGLVAIGAAVGVALLMDVVTRLVAEQSGIREVAVLSTALCSAMLLAALLLWVADLPVWVALVLAVLALAVLAPVLARIAPPGPPRRAALTHRG